MPGVGGFSKNNARNLVLTGPGRSGTTLACHLLNKLPDVLALPEPISPGRFADLLPDYEAVCDGVERYYRRARRLARTKGVAISKHVDGRIPDNTKGFEGGVRRRVAEKGRVEIGKNLPRGFFLAIKQPGMFTALLPHLAERFPCYAVVRNPLAVMASAGTLQRRQGRVNKPASVRYDPGMARALEGIADPTERSIRRLNLFFGRYLDVLPPENIVRYEDVCATGGRALSAIVPSAANLDEPLEERNVSSLYDRERVLSVGEQLLASDGAYWRFYSRESVEKLMEHYSANGET